MTDVTVNLFFDIYLSIAKLTLFHDGNCFLIVSVASEYFLRHVLILVRADSSTRSLCNALSDHCSLRFEILFHWILAETNCNMRWQFHMLWWNSEVSKSLAASLEHFVCHFSQYRLTWMSNMNVLCKLTIVIPRLPCLFGMAKAVSSIIELVNSVTSNSVNSFNFAIWALASK